MKFIFITMIIINLAYFALRAISEPSNHVGARPVAAVLDVNVEKIALQHEQMPASIATGVATDHSMCWLAGPFSSLLYAEYFQELLLGLGASSKIRQIPEGDSFTELLVSADYQADSMAQLVERLRGANFETYVSGSEEGERRVSLGRYKDEASIVRGQQLAAQMGISVDRKLVPASLGSHWVEFIRADAAKLIELINKGAVVKKDYNEIRQNVCFGVANN